MRRLFLLSVLVVGVPGVAMVVWAIGSFWVPRDVEITWVYVLGVLVFVASPLLIALIVRVKEDDWFSMLQLPIPAWFGIVEENDRGQTEEANDAGFPSLGKSGGKQSRSGRSA